MTAPARKAMGAHENNATGTDTWLTPRHVLDALGPFDLDPCAAPHPHRWPTAHHHLTYLDDGLSHEWFGRVWCNPPYSRAWRWIERLADHGNGIALLFARTETLQFDDQVWQRADGLLFLRGRLTFHEEDGRRGKGNAGAPSVLVAYGRRNAEVLATCGLPGAFVPGWLNVDPDVDTSPTLFDG
ncbi:DNA methyltransferase [Gordonia phage EMoore]|uniref:Methyltransferase n=1 Tax=Gordonia phage EMoore TaxID=2656534 RepID=A0A649VTQ0_9CAUD|nr:DNA methyltransferase [Gordonia phage EMoore]QGJ95846.1 methyltransferase [Gordonia phage EMoore]